MVDLEAIDLKVVNLEAVNMESVNLEMLDREACVMMKAKTLLIGYLLIVGM